MPVLTKPRPSKSAPTPTPAPSRDPIDQLADLSRRQHPEWAKLQSRRGELAMQAEQLARQLRAMPRPVTVPAGAELVRGVIDVPQAEDNSEQATPIRRQLAETEAAITLIDGRLRDIARPVDRYLSDQAAPFLRELLEQVEDAALSLRDAITRYRRGLESCRFDLTAPTTSIPPDVFGPEGSQLTALIARIGEVLK